MESLVRICRLPGLRDAASFAATRPDLQPGFLEFVASWSTIPPAIDELYRRGLAPMQNRGSNSRSQGGGV